MSKKCRGVFFSYNTDYVDSYYGFSIIKSISCPGCPDCKNLQEIDVLGKTMKSHMESIRLCQETIDHYWGKTMKSHMESIRLCQETIDHYESLLEEAKK